MATCPPPGPLAPPTGVPTINFLNGALPMLITDLWTRANGWKPSGWTRVNAGSTAGKAIIAQLYKVSKQYFSYLVDHMAISDAISRQQPGAAAGVKQWALQVQGFRVKKEPLPGETVGQYRARGGYLLKPGFFDGSWNIEGVVPSWVGEHDPIDGFALHIHTEQGAIAPNATLSAPSAASAALVATSQVYFKVQGLISYPGTLDRAMDWVVNMVRKLCNKLTSDKMQQAAAVIAIGGAAFAATPAGAAALAAAATYQAIAAACGVAWPDCSAPPPPPAVTTPTSTGPSPNTTMVVPGTIAWLDPHLNLYRLAAPLGLGGLKATYVETTMVKTPPGGAEIVNRIAWESATRPFYRRTTFLVGSAAVAVAAAGATIALNRRRHA